MAQPSSSIPQVNHPSLIPTGVVLEIAPLVDVFEIIGKKQKGASSSKAKGKAKQGVRTRRSKKAVFEVIAPEQPDQGKESRSAPLTEQSGLPQIVENMWRPSRSRSRLLSQKEPGL